MLTLRGKEEMPPLEKWAKSNPQMIVFGTVLLMLTFVFYAWVASESSQIVKIAAPLIGVAVVALIRYGLR